jgi:carbonic anhydrase
MDVIDQLLENNTRAAGGAEAVALPAPPALQVAVVTCMDARIDVYSALGLERGQAHVLRNAGGSVTDDVIRSLAISQRRLGTRAVMLIHHTRCGMAGLDEAELQAELREAAGGEAPPFALRGFSDIEQDVRDSIARVRESPYLLHRDQVRGFVFDVDTQLLEEVRV